MARKAVEVIVAPDLEQALPHGATTALSFARCAITLAILLSGFLLASAASCALATGVIGLIQLLIG